MAAVILDFDICSDFKSIFFSVVFLSDSPHQFSFSDQKLSETLDETSPHTTDACRILMKGVLCFC
jgi:hypothetical protein